MPYASACNAIGDVIGGEQSGGRDDDSAELHHGQHGLPERRDVAQQQQHAITTAYAQAAEIIRNAVRALGKFGECELVRVAVFIGHPQRGLIAAVAGSDLVKPIQRPVEAIEPWPLKAGVSCGIVIAMRQKKIASGAESLSSFGWHAVEILPKHCKCIRTKSVGNANTLAAT